jgi:hypothetical protein
MIMAKNNRYDKDKYDEYQKYDDGYQRSNAQYDLDGYKAEEKLKVTKNIFTETDKNITDYIRKNPKKAALIAAGIGTAISAAVAIMIKSDRKR